MGAALGAIDIGTNTVLLTIAEDRDGRLEPVVERARITRLGQGVDANGVLAQVAIDRTLAVLREYGELLRAHTVSAAEAVCTSAVRDASNGSVFAENARRALGVPLRVVAGAEEASLTFEGALTGLDVQGPVTVFDVGGGSTEIIRGVSGNVPVIESSVSLDIGSVRLTERHVKTDPPTLEARAAIAAQVDLELSRLPRPEPRVKLVGVAGTVTTLAAIAARLETYDAVRVHGSELDRATVRSLLTSLAAEKSAERARRPGMEPARADVIVAGAMIVERLLAWANAETFSISDRGVRWGLLLRLSRASVPKAHSDL